MRLSIELSEEEMERLAAAAKATGRSKTKQAWSFVVEGLSRTPATTAAPKLSFVLDPKAQEAYDSVFAAPGVETEWFEQRKSTTVACTRAGRRELRTHLTGDGETYESRIGDGRDARVLGSFGTWDEDDGGRPVLEGPVRHRGEAVRIGSPRCVAKTKAGYRCRRGVLEEGGLCATHGRSVVNPKPWCGAMKADGGRCERHVLVEGTRCQDHGVKLLACGAPLDAGSSCRRLVKRGPGRPRRCKTHLGMDG